ncbi:MAG: hypothetical protein AB1726_08285 [Planctomycetota bacterium]
MSPADKKDPGPARRRGPGSSCPSEGPAPAGEGEEPAAAPLDRAGLLGALSAGLAEVRPGLLILDRDLELEEGGRADLAGVDGSGRIVLVILAAEDVDAATLQILDTVSLARGAAATLARHLGGEGIDPSLPPETIVIDPRASDRLLRRLSPFLGAEVELLGVRWIKSAAGERSYLVVRGERAAGAPAASRDPVGPFLASLPPDLAELGRRAVERISRLDRELVTGGRPGEVAWSLGEDVLVRLEHDGERLLGSVAPRHEVLALAGEADLEPLLEGALARLVEGLEGARGAGDAVPRGEAEPAGPILTPEEIDYFRE